MIVEKRREHKDKIKADDPPTIDLDYYPILSSSISANHQVEEGEEEGNNDNIQASMEDSRIEMISDIVQEPESSLIMSEVVSPPETETIQRDSKDRQDEGIRASIKERKIDYDDYCEESERQEQYRKKKVRQKKASVVYQNWKTHHQHTTSLADTSQENNVNTSQENNVNTSQENDVNTSQENEMMPQKSKRKKRNNLGFISGIPLLNSKRHCSGRDGFGNQQLRVSERNKNIRHRK